LPGLLFPWLSGSAYLTRRYGLVIVAYKRNDPSISLSSREEGNDHDHDDDDDDDDDDDEDDDANAVFSFRCLLRPSLASSRIILKSRDGKWKLSRSA
jgi:hypothetical protein